MLINDYTAQASKRQSPDGGGGGGTLNKARVNTFTP